MEDPVRGGETYNSAGHPGRLRQNLVSKALMTSYVSANSYCLINKIHLMTATEIVDIDASRDIDACT